mmetsp:Transcript_23354/g.43923  ORF Transcript_23354/g.43923 Transcript_23354/m.43923 type:complete len:244 (-) Transcript_23354:278-1009(-)
MDLTIYVQSNGTSAAFALNLDVLPHQLTAIAHISSILQMCTMYAESRASQTDAHAQLKNHLAKVNLIQTQLVNQQKHRTSAKRGMRPMPVILDRKVDDDFAAEEPELVRPLVPRRQKAVTAPAAEVTESERSEKDAEEVVEELGESPNGPSQPGSVNSLEEELQEAYASERQTTGEIDAKTQPPKTGQEASDRKSDRSFLSVSFWKPSKPLLWPWSRKSGRVLPDIIAGHGLSDSIVPTATLS